MTQDLLQEKSPVARSPNGLTQGQFLQVLEGARWAPSGDNCQPWRVRTSDSGDCLEVLLDTDQKPAFLDTKLEASRIALGAFTENATLAASSITDCEINFAEDDKDLAWSRISFAAGRSVHEDPLGHFLRQRVSNRRLYDPQSCSDQDLRSLTEAAEIVPNVDVRFFSKTEDLRTIAEAVGLADRVRMQHRDCHIEFHEKVRWNAKEAEIDPTGFYVNTFEIKRHEALLLRLTRSYSAMRVVDFMTRMSVIAAAVAKRQVMASGAIGMLISSDRSPDQVMRTGRALQRVWLAATQCDLAFQVLAVAPIFIRRCALGGQGLNTYQRQEIAKSRSVLASLDTGPKPEDIVLMFRVGRAAAPSARTGRLPVDAFLVPTR